MSAAAVLTASPAVDTLAARVAPLLDSAPQASAMAVVAVRGDERLLLCGGSTARVDGRQVDAGTRFEVGSISKTYTALLLAEAVARGEADYDDPIAGYLPPGTVPRHRSGTPITLLHLATHTAGLPRLPVGMLATGVPVWLSNPYERYSQERLLRSLAATPVRSRPGSRVCYSNLGSACWASCSPGPPGRTIRPCWNSGSASRSADPHRLRLRPGHATGYWHGRPRPPWRIPALPGAGAVRSSAADLLRYLEALLDPGRAGALGPALAEVQRLRLVLPRTGDGLCLVWNHRRRPGHELLFHSGGTRGFSTFVGYSPATRTALAVLANCTPGLGSNLIQTAYSGFRALAEAG
ncbi:beta-lactamase family protein [Streptacidiphilus sp. 4-A2]|nr:beta-lactamase family protein [Streptacidiphilus sp. 4-A2]